MVSTGAVRSRTTLALWAGAGVLVGVALGVGSAILFDGIGIGYGALIGGVLALALGFSGYSFARERLDRRR